MEIKKLLRSLSDTRIFFFATLWLMVLLVVGTIVQKDIGIYQAQVKYFSSIILWFGIIPLPGGAVTMAVIFVGLFSKLIYRTSYSKRNLGIAVTHFGSFLLLAGGILTGLFSFEGNMVIPEGDNVNFFKDYHKLELAIVDTTPKEKNLTYAFGDAFLEKNQKINHKDLPFTVEILKYCQNCSITPRKDATEELKGFAKRFVINSQALEKEESENRSGIVFKVIGSEDDGTYMIVESMPVTQSINSNGKSYFIDIRHKRYRLPFEIELIDFEKKVHAATTMAKSYKSIIILKDKKLNQRTVVQMNEPLRYKGYTFYQSSFVDEPGKQTTIFAVVKNIGRLFPYISSLVICFGLMIHLLQNSASLFAAKKKEGASNEA